jgi:hypothetical protein
LSRIALGSLGVARLMRFAPRSVMVGFVNALAILIFMAQVPELRDVPWPVYPLVAAALALMVLFPRITKAVPAPLVSIVALTALPVGAGIASKAGRGGAGVGPGGSGRRRHGRAPRQPAHGHRPRPSAGDLLSPSHPWLGSRARTSMRSVILHDSARTPPPCGR